MSTTQLVELTHEAVAFLEALRVRFAAVTYSEAIAAYLARPKEDA